MQTFFTAIIWYSRCITEEWKTNRQQTTH